MTTLEEQLEEKRNLADGMVKQAKGFAREQWGNLSNDDKARLVGKKEQVVGKLQQNYGNSWAVRNRNWLMWGTAVALSTTLIAFIMARKNRA